MLAFSVLRYYSLFGGVRARERHGTCCCLRSANARVSTTAIAFDSLWFAGRARGRHARAGARAAATLLVNNSNYLISNQAIELLRCWLVDTSVGARLA